MNIDKVKAINGYDTVEHVVRIAGCGENILMMSTTTYS
jgi:hypothetical protein